MITIPKLMEALGFEKEVDFVSCYLPADSFKIPERVERIAQHALERGDLWVKKFKSKRELVEWAPRIGYTYNKAFIHNWEYYPFTEGDVKYAVDNVFMIADHRLIKLIMHKDEIVGFLFAFPDVSAALAACQRTPLPLRNDRYIARDEAHQNDFRKWHGHSAGISGQRRECLALL